MPKADPAGPRVAALVPGAVLAFRLAAAAAARPDAARRLRGLLAAPSSPSPAVLDSLFQDARAAPPGSRPVKACVGLVGWPDLTPVELLECCLRIGMWLERSDYGGAVEKRFARWAKDEWLRVADERRFSLFAPSLSAPAIASAARAEGDGLRHLAAVVEAALLGVRMSLPPECKAWIRSTARA